MTYACCTAHRDGARRQFEFFDAEIKHLQKKSDVMWEAADPVLQMAFPEGPEAGVLSDWQDHLKLVPEWLRAKMKCTALTAMIQALAMVKSHYPRVDLQRFKEGYTVDVDEAKLEALAVEVEPTVESLVENLDLDEL